MGKAKRSRRENLSPKDPQKLKNYKQWAKNWKSKEKGLMEWSKKFDKASPEEKIKMKKELELSEFRRKNGLKAETILSENEQMIIDLQIQAFREMEKSPRTESDIKLSEYSRK